MAATEILPAFSYACGMISAKLSHGERVLLQDVSFSHYLPESDWQLLAKPARGKQCWRCPFWGFSRRTCGCKAAVCEMDGTALPSGKTAANAARRQACIYSAKRRGVFASLCVPCAKQLYDSLKKLGLPRKDFPAFAAEKLRLAGFDAPETILDKYPFQLSGGMAQRVTIALAACSRARLLIADEPTNGLDENGRVQFFSLLDSIFPNAAKLIITHDISVASRCDRVLVLCGGRMLETGASS